MLWVRSGPPLYVEEKPITATISIGIAEAQDSLTEVEALIEMADERLYEAKRQRRDVSIAAQGGEAIRHSMTNGDTRAVGLHLKHQRMMACKPGRRIAGRIRLARLALDVI